MALKSSEIPRRCAMPGCNHEHDTDDAPIYLHGNCHPESATFTFVQGNEAVVECATCSKTIVRLALVP